MRLISAVGTPLTEDESLDEAGFQQHLAAQWEAGIDGVLVAGTMGLMQLLADRTYEQVIDVANGSERKGELFIGVGDASLARTLDRMRRVNSLSIDGAVVLTPYLLSFSQVELVDYFRRLADASTNPLFLYVNPSLTGMRLEIDSIVALARHPNIRGIKCSSELEWTRQLEKAAPEGFRVIYAQARAVDVLCRDGVRENLDGIFAVAPQWTAAIRNATRAGDDASAAAYQQSLNELLDAVIEFGVFPACTVLINEMGISGRLAPAPFQLLDSQRRKELLARPIVQKLLNGD